MDLQMRHKEFRKFLWELRFSASCPGRRLEMRMRPGKHREFLRKLREAPSGTETLPEMRLYSRCGRFCAEILSELRHTDELTADAWRIS